MNTKGQIAAGYEHLHRQVLALAAKGWTTNQIRRHTGACKTTVNRWIREARR